MKRGWEFSEGQVRFRILLIELEVFSWRQKKPQNPLSCYLSCHQQSPFRKQAGKMQSIPVDEQTESCCRKTFESKMESSKHHGSSPRSSLGNAGCPLALKRGLHLFFFSVCCHTWSVLNAKQREPTRKTLTEPFEAWAPALSPAK